MEQTNSVGMVFWATMGANTRAKVATKTLRQMDYE